MKRLILIAALLGACSPLTRARGRCPTLPTLLTDGAIATVGMAVAVETYNRHNDGEAIAWMAGAAVVMLAANLSECRP